MRARPDTSPSSAARADPNSLLAPPADDWRGPEVRAPPPGPPQPTENGDGLHTEAIVASICRGLFAASDHSAIENVSG